LRHHQKINRIKGFLFVYYLPVNEIKIFKMKKLLFSVLLTSMVFVAPQIFGRSFQSNNDNPHITIPIGGNTWSNGDKTGGSVTNNGIENWTDNNTSFTTYVRFAKTGDLKVWVNLKVPVGSSKIQISITGSSKEIDAKGATEKKYYVGEWEIPDTGYIAIQLKGISKTGNAFAEITDLEMEGTAINEHTAYTKNNEGNFFHWGRRGPSVHLNYIVPENENAEWFYNEVTVPKGQDVIGSYFMADGFGEGYFGMQVNSATERHILFSVWSPFKTDNPKDIPEDQKIQLLKKGEDVHAGEFGNEGSGGQSYMNYNWKAGNTCKFLLHGRPDNAGHTIYTAYFYAPEEGTWHLIASFRRPATNTWLKHLYSFLENFSPEQGDSERHVFFGNQWIRTDEGRWVELNKIRFTADNTGRKGYRMDYAGGVKGNEFYLRNCGFFNDYTLIDKLFERPDTQKQPQINLEKLP
jgi:hypothetical protein